MIEYNFYNPTKLIFGANTVGKIGKQLSDQGHDTVLLIAGSGSIKANGVFETVTAALKASNIQYFEYWGVTPNPVLSKVREAIELAKKYSVKAILAVGGGSVIDTAKAVAAGVFVDDIWATFEGKLKISKALPIFTILTLSATASEMNGNAVITNEQEYKKWGLNSLHFYPKVSIIDPSVQQSLPWEQTVNGALDAFAHIMEFYFVGTTEETTIALNQALLQTIITMVDNLQQDYNDLNSRANLAWAATMALNGISGTGMRGGDWSCHGIEHSISCLFPKVAHGTGLGIIFPAWMQYVQSENPKQFSRFAKNVWQCSDLPQAIEKIQAKIRDWKGITHLHELGIKEEQLPALAKNAVSHGALGALKTLQKNDVENILRLAF